MLQIKCNYRANKFKTAYYFVKGIFITKLLKVGTFTDNFYRNNGIDQQ